MPSDTRAWRARVPAHDACLYPRWGRWQGRADVTQGQGAGAAQWRTIVHAGRWTVLMCPGSGVLPPRGGAAALWRGPAAH